MKRKHPAAVRATWLPGHGGPGRDNRGRDPRVETGRRVSVERPRRPRGRRYAIDTIRTLADGKLPILGSVSATNCSAWHWVARRSSSRTDTVAATIPCGILQQDKYLSRHRIMDSPCGERRVAFRREVA